MSTVFVESKDGISYIYLNRPEKYNAIDLEMLADLYQVIEQVEMNEDRVVIISGKGAAFSAGGDLTTPTAKAMGFFGLVGTCHQHHTS
ncbi:MAG TPA: enoyl-CoA hydratase/isomerase family protein [Virgibacillus sp.]|nr:enoyl-CoA hydratase/isomerase family protein [Virgibacillus sp.]